MIRFSIGEDNIVFVPKSATIIDLVYIVIKEISYDEEEYYTNLTNIMFKSEGALLYKIGYDSSISLLDSLFPLVFRKRSK